MGKQRKLTIDCINKVKIEACGTFEDSIFLEVYEKAARHTRGIIEDSIKWRNNSDKDKDILNQESCNNIIPFLGDRGMGKSSAMLSYALFLKNYHESEGELSDKMKLSDKENVGFYLLPRIDAAMLVKGENLLDIVLASMWKIFDEIQPFGNKQENVRKGFLNIKKSYELYVNAITGKEKDSLASVRDLKDLSRCLNLAQNIKELVDSFLPCVSPKGDRHTFLVVTLDDVDTATEDVYAVLEQIRLFLMIPNIIILVSADVGRLYLECSKYFSEKLMVEGRTEKEKDQIRKYAHSYLAKVLPSNRRIYMPDINIDNEKKYEIEIPKFKYRKDQGIKKTVYQLIYKSTGIMLFPYKRTNRVLQYRTLRDIVNVLYMLETIADIKDEQRRSQEMFQWLMSRLEEYIEIFDDRLICNCLKSSLNTELVYMNDLVSELRNYSTTYDNAIRTHYTEMFDYEMMIKILYELPEQYELPDEVCDFLTLLYSVRLSELWTENERSNIDGVWRASENIEKNVNTRQYPFGWGIREEESEKISPDKFQMINLSLNFGKYDSFEEWMTDKKDEIIKIFSKAVFCDQNLWDSEKRGYKKYQLKSSSEGKADKRFVLDGDYAEASIDYFFINMLRYDVCLHGFVENLLNAYKKAQKCDEEFPQKKFNKEFVQKEYNYESLKEIFPLEHVEIMNELTIAIAKIASVGKLENMTEQEIDRICRQIGRIIDILKKVDEYYGAESKQYGTRVSEIYEFWKKLNNQESSEEKVTDG